MLKITPQSVFENGNIFCSAKALDVFKIFLSGNLSYAIKLLKLVFYKKKT